MHRFTSHILPYGAAGLLITAAIAVAGIQFDKWNARVARVPRWEARGWASWVQRAEGWQGQSVVIEPHRMTSLLRSTTTYDVWCEAYPEDDDEYSRTIEVEQFGAPLRVWSSIHEPIPYVDPFYAQMVEWERTDWRVHLAGIIGNTAVFGVATWFVLWIPRGVRGTIRARRGACVACGYDLHKTKNEGCPECGRGRR